jgi:hypothetical protein
VQYDDAVAAFFAPRPDGTPLPEAVTSGSPARRMRAACEPIAMHPVWSRRTNERLAELGLDFLTGYVGGRAAVLGEAPPAVVAAVFAWFEPSVVVAVVEAARSTVPAERLLAVRAEATTESLREVLGDDDPGEVADLLAEAASAADGAGRPLFTAVRERGRPQDAVQRLWWACELVREHRGDSHVAAANVAGLDPVQMNVLTELWLGMPLLSYAATRVWPPHALDAAVASLRERGWVDGEALSDEGRRVRSAVEAATDVQEQPVLDRLGGRLDEVCAQLEVWSEQCVQAGAFPADVLKRAAG